MTYIYLIKSLKNGNVYTGLTDNIEKRLQQHNRGYNPSTKRHIPYELVYFEYYKNQKDATEREHKLKHHGSSMGQLKKRLKNSLNKEFSPKGGVL